MNRFERPLGNLATLRYLDGDYDVITPGTHVLCAITGENITLDDLKYWNVERQEAYKDVEISFQRELELNPDLRRR